MKIDKGSLAILGYRSTMPTPIHRSRVQFFQKSKRKQKRKIRLGKQERLLKAETVNILHYDKLLNRPGNRPATAKQWAEKNTPTLENQVIKKAFKEKRKALKLTFSHDALVMLANKGMANLTDKEIAVKMAVSHNIGITKQFWPIPAFNKEVRDSLKEYDIDRKQRDKVIKEYSESIIEADTYSPF